MQSLRLKKRPLETDFVYKTAGAHTFVQKPVVISFAYSVSELSQELVSSAIRACEIKCVA